MSPSPSAISVLSFPEAGLPERLGPPPALDTAQQEVADQLIQGPRRGVYGPFRPLLHRPSLLRVVAKVGETLRYEGTLDNALREWTICVVARQLSNVFEWDMHLPLAAAAGVPTAALAALDAGEPSRQAAWRDQQRGNGLLVFLRAPHFHSEFDRNADGIRHRGEGYPLRPQRSCTAPSAA